MPCTGPPAALTEGLGCLQQEENPKRMRRQHLLPGKPRPASPTALFLPQAPPVPGRATRELAAAGSSLGRLPELPLQLFLTPTRLQQALGSTGRGSCLSGAQHKVTSGAVR